MPQVQKQKLFYDDTNDRSIPCLPVRPSDEQIRVFLSQNNSNCPLNHIFVSDKNEGNMRMLRRFAFSALQKSNRSCRGCNFGIYASAGQGKTSIVAKFAETIGIPFVFVQSQGMTDTWDLFEQISTAFRNHEFRGDQLCNSNIAKFPEIVEYHKNGTDYTIPPCIVFLDEAHMIPKSLMQGGLLNAMERDDGIMKMRQSSKSSVVTANARNVCWIVATTERGQLFDALDTRIGTAIEWHSATVEESAKIVKMRIRQYFETGEVAMLMPDETCELSAKYRRNPREAIGFAQKVIQQKAMMPSDSWKDSAEKVARDLGIDERGFTHKQILILKALGQRPIAENRLSVVAGCRKEQVLKYELPFLMSYDNGGPLVVPVSKGMAITEAGLAELEFRNINHNGRSVTAEHFEKHSRK